MHNTLNTKAISSSINANVRYKNVRKDFIKSNKFISYNFYGFL